MHTSYGIIPLKKNRDWVVLVIQREKGFWEFPKGHAESGETPIEAAKRELHEETGLYLEKLIYELPFEMEYTFKDQGKDVKKKVYYYLGEVTGDIILQNQEVKDFRWVPLREASQYLTYSNSRSLHEKIVKFLGV